MQSDKNKLYLEQTEFVDSCYLANGFDPTERTVYINIVLRTRTNTSTRMCFVSAPIWAQALYVCGERMLHARKLNERIIAHCTQYRVLGSQLQLMKTASFERIGEIFRSFVLPCAVCRTLSVVHSTETAAVGLQTFDRMRLKNPPNMNV